MSQQEHYSLRWNNHQNHILRAFDTLLQTKTLVDVTLVCAETSIRAHKVVLSACSPFFQRVFSETPCKHPVIVLKDFRGWVVQAIVDFMYRGEISVPQERLQTLIHAGESLQVRGLVDHPVAMNTPTPAASPEDFSILDTSLVSPESPPLASPNFTSISQNSSKLLIPQVFADPSLNLVNRDHCISPTPRRKQARPRRRSGECGPHDLMTSSKPGTPCPEQQTTKIDERTHEKPMEEDVEDMNEDDKIEEIKSEAEEIEDDDEEQRPDEKNKEHEKEMEESPENLCTKNTSNSNHNTVGSSPNSKSSKVNNNNEVATNDNNNRLGIGLKEIRHRGGSMNRSRHPSFHGHPFPPFTSLTPPPSFHLNNNPPLGHQKEHMKAESEDGRALDDDSMMEPLDISAHHGPNHGGPMRDSHGHRMDNNNQNFSNKHAKDFLPNPLNFHPHFNQSDGPPFPPMPSMSALALSSPHLFGLDAPFGLFPPGMDPGKMYNPLMELSDPRTMHPDHPPPPFLKKKLSRAKSQHSAPRGGPPRSWTNAELTKALEHVWNKKMTTSQASRIFGIPYNSLLMYVRGKYGKSLKLEQLRKDCISGPPIEIIQRGISGHISTTKSHKEKEPRDRDHDHPLPVPRSSSSEPDLLSSPNPFFSSFPPGFYPDFSDGFPRLPLDMSSLLSSDRLPPPMPINLDDDCRSNGSKQSAEDDFPQPLALSRNEERRERDRDRERRDADRDCERDREGSSNSLNNLNQQLPKPCVRL